MTLLKCTIVAHLLGLLTFNLFGLFGSYSWQAAYFWWDKTVGGGFLVWLVIYKSLYKVDRWLLKPILIVSGIRFMWQVIVFFTGWDINHEWWLALFFVFISGAACWLTLQKESTVAKFINKNVP